MKFVLSVLGRGIAAMPEWLANALCVSVGWLIYSCPFGRIRVAHSNISHAFPDMPRAERRKIAFESCRRMVEMALFVLASPHLSNENLRSRISVSGFVLSELEKLGSKHRATVLMIPHFAMMETITMFPVLTGKKTPPTGVFYRPFDSPALESWVKSSRQRFGVELLSRKKGLFAAVKFLRAEGCVAVLFDQKTYHGARSLLLDRICTTTELPGILVESGKADCAAFWATRTGFWRSRIDGVYFKGKTKEEITAEGDAWLTEKLRSDPVARYDWLWLHRRWQWSTRPAMHALGLELGGETLDIALKLAERAELPRNTRIFITPPDSFRNTLALLPLVRQLRKSRPDAAVSLLVQNKYAVLVRLMGVADEVISVPDRADGFFARARAFRRLYERYPDVHLVFPDSLADDFQSLLMRADFRLALRSSRRRFFMKGVYSPDAAQSAEHVALEYLAFMRKFGLRGEPDYSPLDPFGKPKSGGLRIAVLCGGEGGHAWSSEKWCALVKSLSAKLSDAKFAVFGGESDSRTAFEIAKCAEFAEIENFAGKLDTAASVEKIAECTLAVGTDCNELHIANALGLETVAIYGATNPLRNGFAFDAPHVEIVPDGCPLQGGGDVRGVSVAQVENAVLSFANKNKGELS